MLVDKNGIQPVRIGRIPPHLAALMQTNINVQALTVEASSRAIRNASFITLRCSIRTRLRNSISTRSAPSLTIYCRPWRVDSRGASTRGNQIEGSLALATLVV